MPKKEIARALTIATDKEKKDEPNRRLSKTLVRQLSIMEGGSCPNSPQVKKAYRLVVLGSSQCGKTCIVNRFLTDTFDDSYLPTIENFHRKLYRIHGEFYQLDILDTSGNDPFPAARRLSLLTGDLFLLVFSVDKVGSYEEILRLRDQIIAAKSPNDAPCSTSEAGKKSSTSTTHSSSSSSSIRIPMAIAANKTDLAPSKREVNLDEAKETLTQFMHCAYAECSAKTGLNVKELFSKLFSLAKLPKQMCPGQHRQITLEKSIDSAVSTSSAPPAGAETDTGRRYSRAYSLRQSVIRLRSRQEPAVAFDTEARRPSLRTDLMLLRAKQSSQLFTAPAALTSVSAIAPNNSQKRRKSRTNKKKCCIQ